MFNSFLGLARSVSRLICANVLGGTFKSFYSCLSWLERECPHATHVMLVSILGNQLSKPSQHRAPHYSTRGRKTSGNCLKMGIHSIFPHPKNSTSCLHGAQLNFSRRNFEKMLCTSPFLKHTPRISTEYFYVCIGLTKTAATYVFTRSSTSWFCWTLVCCYFGSWSTASPNDF